MKKLLVLGTLLFGLGVGSAALAQPAYLAQLPPLIDRELFFGDPEISGAQLSPDGRFVSFVKPYRGVMNIWVKGLDEAFEAARPVTADTTRPVRSYFWSQDGRYVLYAQDKGGNENFHVYVVDPAAEAEAATGVPPARDITDYEDTRAMIYAVPENTPGEILVGLNDRDPALHDVYRVDLATGARELVFRNEQNVAGWLFDLTGTLRLGLRLDEAGGTEVLRVDGTALTPVYGCNNEETCGPVRFHKDGRRVYMITNKGDDVDLTRLILFDPATGQEEFVESDPEGQVDFGGAEFSDVTDELVATYYLGDRLRIYPKDEQVARDLERLRAALPEGEIYLGSSTKDERLRLVRVTRDVDPGSTYLYDGATGQVELLYRSRPELPAEHLAEMQALRYPARDGLEIPAYLTVPRGVQASNLPVVIHPHGGPWARDQWGYDSYAQFLANRGYAVLQINFRGSTGYGKAFLNAGNNEWGTGAMQHDLSDGVQYLIDQGIADPQRVAIFGGSYGGYATLAGLAFTPELYAAGISYVGPSNLLTLLKSIPPYWGPIRKIFDVRLGDADDPEDRERLKAQSPLFSADKIRAPLLVIQGANDPRVKQQESDQIVVALRDRGFPVEYLVAPDEGHGFSGKENRLAVAVAIEQFFAEHLGGRAQQDMPEAIAEKLDALTVDVASVEMPELPDADAASGAETAALPEADGGALAPASMTYALTLQTMGQEIALDMNRTIEAATFEDRPVWRVVDAVTLPPQMGGSTALDTFDVDKGTLRPVRRDVVGMGSMSFRFTDEAITGKLSNMGQTLPVNVTLEAPVIGDGAGLELVVAGLPLAAGYTTTLRLYDPLMQRVRPMKLSVAGAEAVETPAGTFETLVVQIDPLDGDEGGTTTLHVTTAAPHYAVQGVSKLPAAMGGGTMKVTLTSMSSGGSN